MKMRPLRVKVRKPVVAVEEEEDSDFQIEALDQSFGLKNVNENPMDKLVLEPTAAVPGQPVNLVTSQFSVMLSYIFRCWRILTFSRT